MRNKRTDQIAIELTDISKKYEIHHEKPTLMEKFVKGRNEQFWALRNINVTIKRGERVGVIGVNGSGKTTLLKIIAGITTPTGGTLRTNGKVVSLIDLEAGFHPDLTGLQNIYLNGMLLGTPTREIDRRLRSIIAFADIHQFIDAPLFTYSEGMKLRLGFAIAVHTDPEILVFDEALTAGDVGFRARIEKQINQFYLNKVTILVVSHWLDFIRSRCRRVIWIDKGSIRADDGPEVVTAYIHSFRKK